jgi:mono/diheme cytochrome c family protein
LRSAAFRFARASPRYKLPSTSSMSRSVTPTGAVLLLLALVGCDMFPGERDPASEPDAAAEAQRDDPSGPAAHLPEGVTAEEVADGERLFVEIGCHVCHGEEGVGTQLGPSLTDGEWLAIGGERDEIARVIVEGVARPREHPTAMPPAGAVLGEEEVRSLAAYVYTLSRGER